MQKRSGRVHAIKNHSASRYFSSAEARDAAEASLPESERERERKKRSAGVTDALLAAIQASTDPNGETNKAMRVKLNASHTAVWSAINRLRDAGQLFTVTARQVDRLFATAEARDAAAGRFARVAAEAKVARAKAKSAARKKREAARKPAKPVKAPKPAMPKPQKQWVQAPVQVRKPPKQKFSDQPAIVPAGVKKQVLPGCPARTRFEPPPFFKGDFQREWQELRSSGSAASASGARA
jgi:hypothetical protein